MKTLATAALVGLALSLAPAKASAAIEGRWILDFDRDGGRAQLTMKRNDRWGNWSSSHGIDLSDFQGLTRPGSSSEVPARFALVRDAGIITFEGRVDSQGGSGRFAFAPAPGFVDALAREGAGQLSEEQVFSAAVHDISRQLVSELGALGYRKLGFDTLVSMRIHGASPQNIRELQSLGYDHLSPDSLVSMRIHGATPEFIRELKALGYDHLSSDSLVSMRIHGATPEYIGELKAAGYEGLSADSLVSLRIHGASPEFVRELKALGYRHLSVDQLVSMRIHGVTLEYVKRMLAADPAVSADELVHARIQGRGRG